MAGTNYLPFDFDLSSIFGGTTGAPNNGANTSLVNFPGFGGGGSAGAPVAGAGNSGLLGNLFSKQSMFGGTDPNSGISTGGWAPVALGAGQAIFGALQGNKAMGLAEKQFKEGQRQFDLNFGAQRQTINTQLEDRQRARVASNANAYENTADYLKKNKV
jgi:hypothetical protein